MMHMDEAAKPKNKVLLLDDEKFLLYMYQIVFEKNGYEVLTFSSADEALTALRSGYDPDVILFDVTMPQGRSGYEFLEIMGNEKLGKRSMKIALTNEGQEGEIKRLADLGADAHMLKAAYIPSQLATLVTDLLEKKRAMGK
jgi:CheY-like chemotaxis protein